jgi:hypothetical protein
MAEPPFLKFIRTSVALDSQINTLGVVLDPVLHDDWSKQLRQIIDFINKSGNSIAYYDLSSENFQQGGSDGKSQG